MLQDEGEFADASKLKRRALKICEDSYGADDPRVARALLSLAELYEARGRPSEAEAFVQEAHRIHAKAAGPGSPAAVECMLQIVRLRKTPAVRGAR